MESVIGNLIAFQITICCSLTAKTYKICRVGQKQ